MAAFRPFSLSLARPLETAGGSIESRDGFVVVVGSGIGEATPLPGWTESLAACRRALTTLGGDEDAALGALEGTPAARHGLALALADRDAREAGVPLYRHLGGEDDVGSVPVNATIGDGSLEETVAAAEAAVEDGFDCLKVKVGARPVEADVERLAGVRDAAGDDRELRADANGAWSAEQAERALDAMADIGVAYVEQPLPADDLAGHAALRGGDVGIALDEALAHHPPDELVGSADVLILKPMVLGGVERARGIATHARDAGVEAVVTTTVDGVVARTAAVHLAASLPDPPACGLATADRLSEDLAPDPAPVEDGAIRVPAKPGLGVRIEEVT